MEWKKNNVSVVEHLLNLQAEDGYFKYTKYTTSNPIYMTACAIMALLGKPHPVKLEQTTHEQVPSATPTPASPIQSPTPTPTPTPTQSPTPAPLLPGTPVATPSSAPAPTVTQHTKIPGFEFAIAILALFVVLRLRR
jgi:hypothetical protein